MIRLPIWPVERPDSGVVWGFGSIPWGSRLLSGLPAIAGFFDWGQNPGGSGRFLGGFR